MAAVEAAVVAHINAIKNLESKLDSRFNLSFNPFFVFICLFIVLPNFLFSYGENIKSIQADFEQITISHSSNIKYIGKFYAKSPGSIKWIYETPIQKEIYINNKKSVIYEPMLEQVYEENNNRNIDFFSILKDAKPSSEGKLKAVVENNEFILELKNNIPYKLSFQDEFSNTIEILFKNVKLNQKIDDKEFKFIAPSNVDIVKKVRD